MEYNNFIPSLLMPLLLLLLLLFLIFFRAFIYLFVSFNWKLVVGLIELMLPFVKNQIYQSFSFRCTKRIPYEASDDFFNSSVWCSPHALSCTYNTLTKFLALFDYILVWAIITEHQAYVLCLSAYVCVCVFFIFCLHIFNFVRCDCSRSLQSQHSSERALWTHSSVYGIKNACLSARN